MPLAAMPAETIDTPAHLADHLLSTITRLAGSAAARVEADLAPGTTMITRTRRAGGGLGWRWMRGEMAALHEALSDGAPRITARPEAMVDLEEAEHDIAAGNLLPLDRYAPPD